MNIEHYKNFIKIADLGNISNAAKTLLIAQPSLSKQIKMLEQEFGAPLLKRNARNVELTPAGEIFYEKARLICELNSSCHDEINSNILGIILPGIVNVFGIVLVKQYMASVPDSVLEAADIAETVWFAASMPEHVQIAEMLVLPTCQATAGIIHKEL